MRHNFFIYMAIVVTLLTLTGSVSADYIVNTGTTGSGTPYALDNNFWLAGQFTVAESKTITSLEGYIKGADPFDPWNPTNIVTTAIFPDMNNLPELKSTMSDNPALYSSQFVVGKTTNDWYGPSGLNWSLSAGTYWAVFEVLPGDDFDGAFFGSAVTPLSRYAVGWAQGLEWKASNLSLGIRIGAESVPVPEPGTMLLLGFGITCLAVYGKLHKTCKK